MIFYAISNVILNYFFQAANSHIKIVYIMILSTVFLRIKDWFRSWGSPHELAIKMYLFFNVLLFNISSLFKQIKVLWMCVWMFYMTVNSIDCMNQYYDIINF